MVWIINLEDSQYYNQPKGIPCYCENIIQPHDLYLQGVLDFNGTGSYTPVVTMFSPSGNTDYGAVTSYFEFYFAINPLGKHYFSARLKNFAPAMCANPCWVLKVVIGDFFNYYTERYCSPYCCEYASDVDIGAQGFVTGGESSFGGLIINDVDGASTDGKPYIPKTGDCDALFLQLETFNDCYSNFSGHRYYAPGVLLQGTAFDYLDKSLINGTIRSLPATIQRDYSLNCKLQRSQKFNTYQLQGNELYPPWKMVELQNWFTNQYIFFNGKRYEIDSGEIFELVVIQNDCNPMYRLNATLRECNVKQIFGCGDICEYNEKAFVMGGNVVGGGGYWDENKMYLGNTCDDLIAYFSSIQGVTSVEQLDPSDYECDFDCGLVVTALPAAYLPTSIYAGNSTPTGRIFGVSPDTLPYICQAITPVCATPVIGTITNEANVCETPVVGTVTSEEMPVEDLYITGYADWVDDGCSATLSQGTVNIHLNVKNNTLTYDAGDPESMMPNIAEQVGYISAAAWPALDKIINNAVLDALGATIIIQSNGYIMYNGQVPAADLGGSTINITDIIYTLP